MKNNLMGVISGVVLTLAVTACGKEPEVQELILGPVPDQQEVSIRLSAPAGFYDEPFSLTMEAGEHIIYYTLDGSMPTMESPVYEEALLIADVSENENVYSARDDVSVFFVLGEYSVPTEPVDKCTVLRAAVYDEAGQIQAQVTASYFVGFQDKTGYEGMNFVSVVTDPANLFDYESGIYVLGKRFDDAVAEGQDYTIEENQGLFPANYEGKGKEWEREAHADFFGTDGALLLSQDLGIRIKGHATRSRLPRGLNFYARKEYGGEKTFGADLLGLGYPVRRMSLYAGGTDRSKAKSAMLAEILRDRSFATITYVPYVLFLDGEYWGVYWLTDKFDATYVEENFGLDKDEAVIIKDGAVELGNEEDIGLYEELQRFFEETDLSVPENYEQAGTLVDMQSLIDYYATEIYVANCDWPFNNFQLWRSRDGGGEGYADGRWRWMLYDLDGIGCMDQWMAGSVSIADVRASDVIFDSLSANAEFRQDFCATLRELGDGVFSSEQIAPVIDRYVSLMYLPVEKESARFAREEEDAAWVQGEYMKGFFENRREFIEGQIEDYLSQ